MIFLPPPLPRSVPPMWTEKTHTFLRSPQHESLLYTSFVLFSRVLSSHTIHLVHDLCRDLLFMNGNCCNTYRVVSSKQIPRDKKELYKKTARRKKKGGRRKHEGKQSGELLALLYLFCRKGKWKYTGGLTTCLSCVVWPNFKSNLKRLEDSWTHTHSCVSNSYFSK